MRIVPGAMSFRGYAQNICTTGHRFDSPDLFHLRDQGQRAVCPCCGAGVAMSNSVDDTNCDAYGFIPEEGWQKFLIAPAIVRTCDMGHQHMVSHAIYHIPSPEEIEPLRTRIVGWSGKTPVRKSL